MQRKQKLYEFLKYKASQKKLTTCGEVAEHLGLDLDNLDDRYNVLSNLMADLNHDMIAQNRPLISSIIVLKNKSPLTTGEGFFEFSKHNKLLKPEDDKALFWAREVTKVFNEFGDLNDK